MQYAQSPGCHNSHPTRWIAYIWLFHHGLQLELKRKHVMPSWKTVPNDMCNVNESLFIPISHVLGVVFSGSLCDYSLYGATSSPWSSCQLLHGQLWYCNRYQGQQWLLARKNWGDAHYCICFLNYQILVELLTTTFIHDRYENILAVLTPDKCIYD